jgi:hypothetical protein
MVGIFLGSMGFFAKADRRDLQDAFGHKTRQGYFMERSLDVKAAALESIRFAVVTFVLVIVAHALAYLLHEYAHSVVAWSLGWMTKPFGIDYGPLTLGNVLFLDDVSDNVDYAPIQAAGHGAQAAIIALAGPFLGNGALYFVAYGVASTTFIQSRRWCTAFVYWFALMSSANVWGYVPLRALTTHADIAIAAKGLGISTWVLFPILIGPALYIVYHFFHKMFPKVFTTITAQSGTDLAMLIAFTGFWYFSFFAGDGISGSYGPIPQGLSILSRYLLFPLAVIFLTSKHRRAAVRH